MMPKLYMDEISPSCRAVLLTAKVLNVTLQKVEVKEFGLRNNTQRAVPTLEEKGFILWDSHAIIAYLVGKYATDDTLYPRNDFERSLIDRMLSFEAEVAREFMTKIVNPMLHDNEKIKISEHEDEFTKIYKNLESFLENNKYIAGDRITIADLCLIPSLTSLNVLLPIDENNFPKLLCYLKRMQEMPCCVENEKGLNCLRRLMSCRVGRCNA